MPNDFTAFSKSALYSILFVPNFKFWHESGYFDSAAHLKPLLHLWSLGVEEQFYLGFPLLLLALLRFGRRILALGIGVIFTLSLTASTWMTPGHPETAFYLIPFRAWELAAGCLLALLQDKLPNLSPAGASLLLWTGLSAIFTAVFQYDSSTVFPGYAAVLPCIGAIAVIWAGRHPVSGNPLTFAPITYLGRISYGFYLWHWPLLVFAIYGQVDPLTTWQGIFFAVIAVVAAVTTYHFVEMPFRQKKFLPRRLVFAVAGLSGLMIGGTALTVLQFRGFPERLPEEAIHFAAGASDVPKAWDRCHSLPINDIQKGNLCRLGIEDESSQPGFLLWGDSHAHALMPALDAVSWNVRRSGLAASYTGCPPLVGFSRDYPQGQNCVEFNRAMLDFAKSSRIQNVVLAGFWSLYTEGWPQEWVDAATLPPVVLSTSAEVGSDKEARRRIFTRGLESTISELLAAGKSVWIINQVPSAPTDVPSLLAKNALRRIESGPSPMIYATHMERQAWFSNALARFPDVQQIDPSIFLCTQGACQLQSDGRSLYYDRHHLSVHGALAVNSSFRSILENAY